MSENPAPFWITRLKPRYNCDGRAWIAAVVWVDTTTGHELSAEHPGMFSTYAEAMLASQDLAEDSGLLDRLLELHPRDLELYWRARRPGLDQAESAPPGQAPEQIGLTEWLRRQDDRRRRGSGSEQEGDSGPGRPVSGT